MRRRPTPRVPIRLGLLAAVLWAAAAGCQNSSSSSSTPPPSGPTKAADAQKPGVGPIQRPAVPPP